MSESLLSYIYVEDDADPVELFHKWFYEAKDYNASQYDTLCLSTLDGNGGVNARYLKLRNLDKFGFSVVTDSRGSKAQEIAHCSKASMVFLFSYKIKDEDMVRQVRIRGNLILLNPEEVKLIYEAEPLIYKTRSHLLPQGCTIHDWNIHKELCETVYNKGKESPLPMPEHFIGYKMIPEHMDFYQGPIGMIADRIIFWKTNPQNNWSFKRVMV